MDKFIAVFKREYLERVRTRAFVIGTLLVPLFIVAIFALPMYLASRSTSSATMTNIVILDATGTSLGERIAGRLVPDTAPSSVPRPQLRKITRAELAAAEQTATQEVMSKKRVGYLVLTDSTLAGRSAKYAGSNASTISDTERLTSAMRQSVTMVRLEQEGVNAERISALSRLSPQLATERLDDRGRGAGSAKVAIMVGFGIAILLYMSIILHGQNVLRGVMEEKTTRVAEVVLSSVKPDVLLAGKVLGVGAVGLTQQILWLGISTYLLQFLTPMFMKPEARAAMQASGQAAPDVSQVLTGGVLTPELFATVLAFFLVGFVFYATLFAAVGAMVNSEQEAQQAAAPVMILLVSTFVMVQGIMLNPNGTLAEVLSWLPFSSPIVMPMRMTLVPVPWYSVVGSLVVGILGCAAAVWLAARIYRVGMLMYGKRPSIGELIKWIRYAG
jgi:ABC-2 type transport system permease protein